MASKNIIQYTLNAKMDTYTITYFLKIHSIIERVSQLPILSENYL